MKNTIFLIVITLRVSLPVLADSGNYSKLLQEVAETCVSGNHEPEDCRQLRQGADDFGIPMLADLANMLENRVLDKGNKVTRGALAALAEYAKKHFGAGSRENVICNRFYLQAIADTEKDLALQIARENARKAERLYQRAPKDTSTKILHLVTQMERVFMERQKDMEVPIHWHEVFEIEKSMEPIAKGHIPQSPEWIDLCQYLSMWKAEKPGADVLGYVDYLSRKTFPEGVYIPGLLENGYINNAEGWAQKAYDNAKSLWGEHDIRAMRCELQLLTVQLSLPTTDYEKQYHRLKEMQSWLEQYLPHGDLLTIEVELLRWDYDVFFVKNLYEVSRYNILLFNVEKFYEEKNISYLNYLHRILNQQFQTDTNRASILLREEEQLLLEELFPDHSDLYWSYQIGTAYSRFALSATQSDAFWAFLSKLNDYYNANHKSSWSSVYVGRSICEIYRQMQRQDEAIAAYTIALDDMRSLADKQPPLWTFLQSSYVGYLSESNNQDCLKKVSIIIDDVIHDMSELDCSVVDLHYTKANVAFALGQDDKGIELLRQGIKACINPQDLFYRCTMQMELGNRLYSRNGNYVITPEIQALFDESIPFFMENREEAEECYFNCYLYLADYYTNSKQYEKAEETYLMGMQHLEMKLAQFNYIYSNLATGLFSLYAYQLNNMDKADQLIESCIKSAETNYNFNAHIFVANLLYCRYELLASKNVDSVLQLAALSEYLNQVQLARNMNEGDEETLMAMYLKLLFTVGNYIPDFAKAMRESEEATNSTDEALRSMAMATQERLKAYRKDFDSFLEIVHNEVNEQRNHGAQSDEQRLASCYQYLGNHYLYLCNDTTEAEKYYELLCHTQAGKIMGLRVLATLRESQGDYSEAARLLEQIVSTDSYETYTNLQNKASDAYCLFANYYCVGQYGKALDQARLFSDFRRQLALLNFDLMTQMEREVFVNQGSTGGAPLYSLLPIFKQELAVESFNAILSEKGLQLRASERIKKALSQLKDSALIAKQDSLNRLQAYYKTLNSTDYMLADVKSNEIIKCRQRIETLERVINREASNYIEGMNTPNYRTLQGVLKHDEVAIEYVIPDTISLGVLLVSAQGEPQYVELSSLNELWNGMDGLKNLDAKLKAEILYQEDKLNLYDKLWKPFEDKLQGIKTVYYSPTGFLNDLAFAAFKCPDGSYLSEHYDMHQMLSTGDLVDLRNHPDNNPVQTAALYGSVFYSPEQEELSQQIVVQESHRGAIGDTFNYLPFTNNEVIRIENVLNNRQVKVKCLTGFASTEESIHAMSEHSPDVLHLSTHGFFVKGEKSIKDNKFLARFPAMRFSSMQRSGLAFVNANKAWEGETSESEDADGILTANEVAMLDLSKTRLVVLSACQTAVGDYALEGVYGMHRGFKQAGVKSILATLWNVNDKSTARLMELFYQNWLSGTPMQQSLSKAVSELRKEYPSPFYWAPFVLMDAEN